MVKKNIGAFLRRYWGVLTTYVILDPQISSECWNVSNIWDNYCNGKNYKEIFFLWCISYFLDQI
jgi:hypothetical protein